MAIPTYLHFGFLVADSIGEWKSLRVASGDETDSFEACVESLLGDVLESGNGKGRLFRDKHGIITLALWQMDGQATLMRLLLELQRASRCQVIYKCGSRSHSHHPDWLEERLRYFVENFREDVTARWGGGRSYPLADELLMSNAAFQALVAKSKASPRKPFAAEPGHGPAR